jgi:hypothetical protein
VSITDAKSLTLNGRELKMLEIGGSIVWEAASAITLSSFSVGAEISIEETAGVFAPYIVIAHDHHGAGLTTLIRKYATDKTTRFHYSAPSGDAGNKYDGSQLELFLTRIFDDMPSATQEKIAQVAVPTRSSAMGNYTIIGVDARLFPLSEMELSGSGNAEGTHIPYFDSAQKRIAYSETGTARASWTRTVAGGMPNFARQISTSGSISSQSVTGSMYVRPACCVQSSMPVSESGGVYIL